MARRKADANVGPFHGPLLVQVGDPNLPADEVKYMVNPRLVAWFKRQGLSQSEGMQQLIARAEGK